MSSALKRPSDTGVAVPPIADANGSDAADASRQRKFFPRLKTLLSDEYEDFLRQVIDIIEGNQCAAFPMATQDTPWADAFETIYQTVASAYALPQGKNRLHKFKEKMVELWCAMQGEVTLGVKSEAHPIYRMALKQWKLHQSVMKDKSKALLTPNAAALAEGGDISDQDLEDVQRPRKKPRSSISEVRKGAAEAEQQVVDQPQNIVTMPVEMMDTWMKTLTRLEIMLTAGGFLQPKLPSPLYELHRLKAQMLESEFDSKVGPLYEQEIGRYLAHITAQCRTCAQPGYLPHLLDGVDMLRQSPQPPAVKKSLDYAHKTILAKYLKLITKESEPPTIPKNESPTVTVAATPAVMAASPGSILDRAVGVAQNSPGEEEEEEEEDGAAANMSVKESLA